MDPEPPAAGRVGTGLAHRRADGRGHIISPLSLPFALAALSGRARRQLQFEFALWSWEMVRELIRGEFGVGLSVVLVVSVGRLLARMGLSPQRPAYRACQQDSEGCTAGRSRNTRRIAAWAVAEGGTICVADEAGIASCRFTAWPRCPGVQHMTELGVAVMVYALTRRNGVQTSRATAAALLTGVSVGDVRRSWASGLRSL